MNYKLVIFDFDGTLADTFPWAMRVVDQIIEKFHITVDRNTDIDDLRGCDTRSILRRFDIPLWKMALISRYGWSLMADSIDQISLFAGIDRLLNYLASEDVRLAVVSSNSYKNIRRILGPMNSSLIDYFECGVPLFGKPSKLKKILKKSKIQPDEALCIGDEIRDIQAANKVNIPFGAVTWGYNKIEALKVYQPQAIFNSIEDIFHILK